MKTTVTITQGDLTCAVSVNDQDANMGQLFEMIQQACLGVGYAPATVAKYFEDEINDSV